MKNLDHQARSNVLMKLIHAMGDQMANRSPQAEKALHVEIKHGAVVPPDADADGCPHCDGEGCRFCK